MTKLPLEDRNVHGFEGPEYQLARFCAKPNCSNYANERHHIFRRSALGGPFNWVALPDGSAVGNVLMLCHKHHRVLTDNEAKLSWDSNMFWWVEDSAPFLPLSFQPPWVLHEVEHTHHDESRFENLGGKTRENECPVCHQALPRPKVEKPAEPKRLRRTWSITVPADRREDGAETLDTLLEEARVELDKAGLSYGDERSTRFFVLATVLGLFVHHFSELVREED